MTVEIFIECPKCSIKGSGFWHKIDSIEWDDQEFEITCDECNQKLTVTITNIDTSCVFK